MSRIAKSSISIPVAVEVLIKDNKFNVKGKLGEQSMDVHSFVNIENKDNVLSFSIAKHVAVKEQRMAWAQAGTARALAFNLIKGVVDGWEKKLVLIGVGYRAQAKGKLLNLTLGFSHPVNYNLPEGVSVETPSQTEITLKGIDKQLIGQVAADIRSFRPPEPYKGKGIRYFNEQIARKEAKKK